MSIYKLLFAIRKLVLRCTYVEAGPFTSAVIASALRVLNSIEGIVDDKKKLALLKKFPDAVSASSGVIIDLGDGYKFHVTNVWSRAQMEGLTEDEVFFLAICSREEIFRLRELQGAEDALLRYRAMGLVDNARYVRVMQKRKKLYEESGNSWSLSRYYKSQDYYHEKYVHLLNLESQKKLEPIPKGVALVYEATALCYRGIAGDYVVVSEALEKFFYFMNLGVYGKNLGIEQADAINALLISVRVMFGIESLDFDLDSRGDLPELIENRLNELVELQMGFTFGHEFAHFLLGHLDKDSHSSLKTYDLTLEYDADLWAILHVEKEGYERDKIIQGGFCVLLFLHFLERAASVLRKKKFQMSDTHPLSKDRLWALQKSLGARTIYKGEELSDEIKFVEDLVPMLVQHIDDHKDKDLLNMVGSVYLPGYKSKILTDKIDF